MINWRLEQFAELNSTSDYCAARATAGEPEGLAVLALHQTAGRGSRGRRWEGASGNLFLSVLLRPQLPMAAINIFPLLVGLAVAQALEELLESDHLRRMRVNASAEDVNQPHIKTMERGLAGAPAPVRTDQAPGQGAAKPMLKWPNDILLNGAKLAGILIDSTPTNQNPTNQNIGWLVAGIGVNLASAPHIPGRLTSCLLAHGANIAPPQAATAILQALNIWLLAHATHGAAYVRQAWLARAHGLGTILTVQSGGHSISGAFAGLSEQAELLLLVETRIEKFQTGEILLGNGS